MTVNLSGALPEAGAERQARSVLDPNDPLLPWFGLR